MFNRLHSFQSSNSSFSSIDPHKEDISSSSDEELTSYSLASNRPKKRAGRRVFKETRHPIYRGVRRRNGDKWVCEMREPNNKKTRIWLGTYPTPEMAARAHDVAALAFRGKSACLNFADSAWRLPLPSSLEAAEVRRVANEAAQMFLPGVGDDEPVSSCAFPSSQYVGENAGVIYEDEEETLGMRGLINEMAQGLLIPPPNFSEDTFDAWDNVESNEPFSLWSY